MYFYSRVVYARSQSPFGSSHDLDFARVHQREYAGVHPVTIAFRLESRFGRYWPCLCFPPLLRHNRLSARVTIWTAVRGGFARVHQRESQSPFGSSHDLDLTIQEQEGTNVAGHNRLSARVTIWTDETDEALQEILEIVTIAFRLESRFGQRAFGVASVAPKIKSQSPFGSSHDLDCVRESGHHAREG